VLALGCHRKAPGPEDCHEFALRAVGVSALDLQIPGNDQRVNDLTTECLLTPYDRELLACVEQGLPLRPCLRQFAARHAGLERASPVVRRRRDVPFP
jgi:hypothetical protein